MEKQEFQIVTPEGYEIDKENSTFEKIVFKKKDDKPRTWEDFCNKYEWTGEEYFISSTGYEKTTRKRYDFRFPSSRGYVSNKEEAEAFVALMQLRQLRKAWVGDWEPEWSTSCAYNDRYGLINYYSKITVEQTENNNPLSFPTEEMAKEFINCFKDLLEQAKMLL